MCCHQCCHKPEETVVRCLFFTTFDHRAGAQSEASTVIAFGNVVKAAWIGQAVKVYLAGADTEKNSSPGIVWLYGDDRERFFREWQLFEERET